MLLKTLMFITVKKKASPLLLQSLALLGLIMYNS